MLLLGLHFTPAFLSSQTNQQPGVRPAPFQPFADLLSTASGSAAFALKPAFSPNADPEQWNADMGRLVELKAFRRAFRACCDKKRG